MFVPASEAELTEQARAFSAAIEAARARWEYCFGASHFRFRTKRGDVVLCQNKRSIPLCAKILGRRKFWVDFGFRRIRQMGFDGAEAWDAERLGRRTESVLPGLFDVGPVKAWDVGHVYFARVADFPHVVKIGFSRRVHERLEDIESSVRMRLIVRPGELKVGTLLNEHWWHRNWRSANISGEWFFDPHMKERTVPTFLQKMAEAA